MEKMYIAISFEEQTIKILSSLLPYISQKDLPSKTLTDTELEALKTDNTLWENKFKLHFPHHYQKSKRKKDLPWYNEFFIEYITQYRGLSENIQRLFWVAKEGSAESLEDYIAQNSEENSWVQHLAKVDACGMSVLEWIRKSDHQSLLDCIYENIIKIDANSLITVNEKIKLSPQSTLWFVLCR